MLKTPINNILYECKNWWLAKANTHRIEPDAPEPDTPEPDTPEPGTPEPDRPETEALGPDTLDQTHRKKTHNINYLSLLATWCTENLNGNVCPCI